MANTNAPADAASNLDSQPVKPANSVGQTPVGLLKDAGAGVPEQRQEGNLEGGTTLPERFRDAAGIDKIPAPGTVNGAARKVEDDASSGGPVRVRPQESMVTPDGQTVNGRIYTKQGQEYFAQTEGENRRIYPVTRSENGLPTLQNPDTRTPRGNNEGEPVGRRDESGARVARDGKPVEGTQETVARVARDGKPVEGTQETVARVARDGKPVEGTQETVARVARDGKPVDGVDTPGRTPRLEPGLDRSLDTPGRQSRREENPGGRQDDADGRVGRDGKRVDGVDTPGRTPRVEPVVDKSVDTPGRTPRVEPVADKSVDTPGRTPRVEPVVDKSVDTPGRTPRVEPVVDKSVDTPGRTPRVEPVVDASGDTLGRHRRRDADSAATPDGTTPVKTERELRVEQNRAVLTGQGDQVQVAQATALAQQRAQNDKATVPATATAADIKGQPQNPLGVNPGNQDSKPGADNKGIPSVPSPVAEVRLPGSDNKGQNPVLEPRSTMPNLDGKTVQQVVTESKPFQQLPPERQAEIIKGLNEVQRQTQPNQGEKPLDSGAKPVDLGVKPADLGGKPVDFGAKPVDLGVKPADLGGKPIDTGAKPVDTGMRPGEVKLPDGKPLEVRTGEALVPGRGLDPSGNPLRGPDGNPMKFSDMIAAGIKPGDILRPGEIKPGEGVKAGDALKVGEGLKPGEAQKATDAIAGKAIDPALVAKLGEGIKLADKVVLPGAELPGGKLATDSVPLPKDTKGGVSDGASTAPTSALSDMAKALGLSADAARTADGKTVNQQDLKMADSALKATADALKPTTLEAGKVEVKTDLKGLDVARPDSALNLAAKLPTPDATLPGVREVAKADGALGAKGENAGKLDATGRPEAMAQKIDGVLTAPMAVAQRLEVDKNAPTVKGEQLVVPGDKLDTTNTTKIELDPDKKAADTAGSAAKFDELIEKAKKQREEEKFDEEDQLNSRNAMMMALLAQKKQKQEQEEKEFQLRNDDAKKKDEDKRRRYVVKEKETLESIAKKQLRDVRLAALIYEINKHMLPIRMEKGKQVVDPRPGTAIWLPTEAEIKEFRSRLYAASNSDAGAGAPGAKFGSVEDELAAKFGSGWDGAKAGASAVDGMMGSAVAKSQTRRENIEKILGPMSDKPSDNARIRYIVRLTDSIESVAQKHPALKDASLWPLVASVNHLPTGLDQFGRPAAELRRGMVLDIPLPYEIEAFRLESNTEDLDEESDDEDDYDQESDDESVDDETSSSDLGVETSDTAPAVSNDWESTVKLNASHPNIASPALPAAAQLTPAVMPHSAPDMAPIATPVPAPVVTPAPSPAQSPLAAQAAAAAAPSPYTAQSQPAVPFQQVGQVSTPVSAKPSFPFASQQTAAAAHPTLPLPAQAPGQASTPLPVPAQGAVPAPAQVPAPVQVPPATFVQAPTPPQPLSQQPLNQQLHAQQTGQQHTLVSQPVAPQPAVQVNVPASAPATSQVSPQPSSQTDTNPVLSAVPVISQIQAGAGAQPSQLRTALDQPPIDAGDRFIWQLDPSVRLVKSTMKWDPSVGVFRSQLELLLNEIWYPVIFYEVFPHMAVRHEYIGGGRKKSVKMDLPPTPAQELADNDLVNNWQRYCHNFVAQMNGPKTGPPM